MAVERRGKAKPGPGRTRLPDEKKLGGRKGSNARVIVNLTQGEKAELEEAAGQRSLSAFVREILKRFLARRRK